MFSAFGFIMGLVGIIISGTNLYIGYVDHMKYAKRKRDKEIVEVEAKDFD